MLSHLAGCDPVMRPSGSADEPENPQVPATNGQRRRGRFIEMDTLEQRYLGLVARIGQYRMPDAARARVLAEVERVHRRERAYVGDAMVVSNIDSRRALRARSMA